MIDRFKSKYVVAPSGCWEWTACRDSRGYGRFRFGAGHKLQVAHRVSYVLRHGDISDGMNVLHRCDNPRCVNPDHLFLGTQADNMADMTAKGRRATGSRHGIAKVSDEDVTAIRACTGQSQADIAKRFGISQQRVSEILRGKGRIIHPVTNRVPETKDAEAA